MNNRIKDINIGDVVYCQLIGNASLNKTGEELIEEWEIVKIGRKYLTARNRDRKWSQEIRFEIEDDLKQKTEYTTEYKLYRTKQEILDEFERNKLVNWFRSEFSRFGNVGYALENLRNAKDVLCKEVQERTIENCTVIKNALRNEISERPETEQHEGKTYCQGYEGAFGDPYHKCQDCKVSIYSLEVYE